MNELHLAQRPQTFKDVVGQKGAVSQLTALGKSKAGLPHFILFTGASGCGKTTLARILRHKLKCGDSDFREVNAAENRGIDMVRNIQNQINLAPMDGNCRVWLIDECHQLTADAQGAFLKLLEEPPAHAYIFLATTNPEKLRKAIRTRATEIKVRELDEGEIVGLVTGAAEKAGLDVNKTVAKEIASVAEGSARKALVLLQQVGGVSGGTDAQMKLLQAANSERAAFEICQAIMKRAKWSTLAAILKGVDDEPEGLRYMVLAYFGKVALGGGKNAGFAVRVMECFEYNYFDTKKAGLIMSCFKTTEI